MQEIIACDARGDYITDLVQWDRDVNIYLSGEEIDSAYQVHFFNNTMDNAIVMQSTFGEGKLKVKIPNSLLSAPYIIVGYVVVTKDGETKSLYGFKINIKKKPRPADYVAGDSDEYLSAGKILDECRKYAETATGASDEAENFAKQAKSWAVGQTGVRVGENTDNAKYYAEQAKAKADSASKSATSASTSASNIEEHERRAKESADKAKESEDKAKESADKAGASEKNTKDVYTKTEKLGDDLTTGIETAKEEAIQAVIDAANAKKGEINELGQVLGVKGSAETHYRIGQVNISAENVGAVPLAGGTMTGALTLSGNPTAGNQAATKDYVDTKATLSSTVPKTASASGNAGTENKAARGDHVHPYPDKLSYRTISTTGDLNDCTEMGWYYCTDSLNVKNYPYTIANGVMQKVSHAFALAYYGVDSNQGTQLLIVTDTVAVFYRSRKAQYGWSEWGLVVNSGNLSSFGAVKSTDVPKADGVADAGSSMRYARVDHVHPENAVPKSGGTMTGALTLSGVPTETNHAATKGYVDSLVKPAKIAMASLTESSWQMNITTGYEQSIPIPGVLEDETKQVISWTGRTNDDKIAIYKYGVQGYSQAAGSLCFCASEKPNGNIKLNIIIQEV